MDDPSPPNISAPEKKQCLDDLLRRKTCPLYETAGLNGLGRVRQIIIHHFVISVNHLEGWFDAHNSPIWYPEFIGVTSSLYTRANHVFTDKFVAKKQCFITATKNQRFALANAIEAIFYISPIIFLQDAQDPFIIITI